MRAPEGIKVIVNIKQSAEVPARQRQAWREFLDMLVERAEAVGTAKVEARDYQSRGGSG